MCIDQLLSGLTKTTRHARPRVCAVGIHPTRNRRVTAVIIQLSRRAYFDFDSCTRGIAAVARKSTRSFPFIYRGRTERCFRHESYAISTHTQWMYSRIRNQQISSSFRSSNAIYVSTCNNELAECPALTAVLPHTHTGTYISLLQHC